MHLKKVFLVLILHLPLYSLETDLYILGLFPMQGAWRGGLSIRLAAELALEHVNNNSDILPGYRLNLIWNDTGCHAGMGVNSMYRNLYSPPVKILILGAGCSFVSEATAQASHLWNLVQMSWGSISPSLSDKTTFPRFFRANPPDVALNPARILIFKKFGWQKIGTILTSYELFTVPTTNLVNELPINNMSVIRSEIITKDPSTNVKNLKNADVRIIVGSFYEGTARKVFCDAYKYKLYGPKIVWITPGWYEADWWMEGDGSIDCTPEQLALAVEGNIYVSRVLVNPKDEVTVSGITPTEFLAMYRSQMDNRTLFGAKFGTLSYDSIWALSLALNASQADLASLGLKLEDFSYTNDTVGSVIFSNMQKVRMMGTAGQLSFNEKGDPIGLYTINTIKGGKSVLLGLYNPELNPAEQIEWFGDVASTIWENGKIPRDSILKIVQEESMSLSLYAAICSLSSLGIITSLVFLAFNIHYRQLRVIKMSSPQLNNVTIIGCLLLYLTPFFENVYSSQYNAGFCTAKGFLMAIGFSLAFGALFAKTWRVHIVFTNSTKRKKIVKDNQLLAMVAALVAVNTIVLITWVFVDPMQVVNYNLTPKIDEDEDVVTQGVVKMCESPNQTYFMATLFALQGILMLLGAFLAWETRKVKIDGLNDSKMIGMSVYNVLVLSLLGVTVSMALKFQININYALTSVIIILATTVTQSLIFVPKIMSVKSIGTQVEDTVGEMMQGTSRFQTVAGTTLSVAPSSSVTAQRLIAVEKTLMEKTNEVDALKKELKKYKGE